MSATAPVIVVTPAALTVSVELESREFRDVAVTDVPLSETVTVPLVRALISARSDEVPTVPKSEILTSSFPKPEIVPAELAL